MLAFIMALWMKVALVCLLSLFLCVVVCMSRREPEQFDFYLAGGMRGYKDKNKAMFFTIATMLREEGYTVFNPGEVNDERLTFAECMTVDLDAIIHRCKGIAFLPGWRDSLGANTEALVAMVCGKPAFQTRLIKKGSKVSLKRIGLVKKTLPYKTKRRS